MLALVCRLELSLMQHFTREFQQILIKGTEKNGRLIASYQHTKSRPFISVSAVKGIGGTPEVTT
jgi:hypothetical protein